MQQQERDWSGLLIIQRDPQKLGGAPTVRGYRITPDAFIDNYDDGMNISELMETFPGTPEADIRAVLDYAERRGYIGPNHS